MNPVVSHLPWSRTPLARKLPAIVGPCALLSSGDSPVFNNFFSFKAPPNFCCFCPPRSRKTQ